MNNVIEQLRNRLIVSVQALQGNPLRDTYCIAHLAAAAAAGLLNCRSFTGKQFRIHWKIRRAKSKNLTVLNSL